MNSKEDFLNNDLFRKWVNSNDEEVNNYWQQWMKDNPDLANSAKENRELFRAMRFEEFKPKENLVNSSWNKVDSLTKPKRRFINLNTIVKIAAVLAVAVVAYFPIKEQLTKKEQELKKPEQTIVYVEKQAKKGSKLTLNLGDGSIIKLNAGSSIIYPSTFAADKREVELKGEAYFEIAHDENRPFTVKSDKLLTTVLGTKFSINAFKKEKIKITLVSGKVKVENTTKTDEEPVYLEPGLKVVLRNNQLNKEKLDSAYDLGWKDGMITFKDEDIDEIKEKLENWYGVDIQINNKGKIARSFKGIYRNELLTNVLASIGYAMNFEYEINGNNVLIVGK
ncbi:FecR family protein [Chondrinema litorale]|uniref:FecR family protein n=1 Tax=Chondrinema litorale TaxID=2994555 RepID=UPI002543A503|nr:FecR family protein [Chondrinema litorale]UZR97819.1 FecR family protein [Chondrinema litorale]